MRKKITMLKKWKKAFALLMVALTFTFALTACVGANKPKSHKKKKMGQRKIVVSVANTYYDYISKISKKFEKLYHAKVKIFMSDTVGTLMKLPVDGPKGIAPDIFLAPYDRIGGLSSEGQIAEVKSLNKKEYDDKTRKLVTIDGKTYGVPFIIETLVAYYNKDIFPEPPKTFEELETLASDPRFAYEEEEGKNTAFLSRWTDYYFVYGLLSGYGGYVFGKNGTNPNDIGIGSKGTIEGLKYAKKWYDMWPSAMRDEKDIDNFIGKQFDDGKAAVVIDGPWQAHSYRDSGVNVGISEIPTLPNGHKYEAFAGGKVWAISNYSKEKKISEKFIEYVTNNENQKLLYDMTQEVPAGLSGREYAMSKGDELAIAVINQFKYDQPMPNIAEMAEVWQPGSDMIVDVATGKEKPEDAAKKAQKEIKKTIKEKY